MSLQKLVSLHGRQAYLTRDSILVGKGGLAAGGDGKPAFIFPSPDVSAVFDDFLGDKGGIGIGDTGLFVSIAAGVGTLSDTGAAGLYFITRKGDTGTLGALTGGTNGIYRMTPSPTIGTPSLANTTSGIVGPNLAWKANQGLGGISGRLRFGCRLKLSTFPTATAKVSLFVGFTDTIAAEAPMHDTGGTADLATATDAVGIMWGTDGDTGWRGVAVNGNTVQEVFGGLTYVTPTDNKWVALEIEVHRGISDTGGTATFFVDGVPKGQIVSPLATNVALTPVIALTDTGGAVTLDLDWVNVSAPRDTGT